MRCYQRKEWRDIWTTLAGNTGLEPILPQSKCGVLPLHKFPLFCALPTFQPERRKERNSEPLLTGGGLYNTAKNKEVFHIRKCPSFLINFIFILIYFAVNVKRYFWEGKFRCILRLSNQAHRRFFQDLIVSASSFRFHTTVLCWPIVLSCLQAHTWCSV